LRRVAIAPIASPGGVVHVETLKSVLKCLLVVSALVNYRTVESDKLHSSFAINFKLRLYDLVPQLLRMLRGAAQLNPMKPKLKPPETKPLKLKCDILLSTSAFTFNLRRYSLGPVTGTPIDYIPFYPQPLHFDAFVAVGTRE